MLIIAEKEDIWRKLHNWRQNIVAVPEHRLHISMKCRKGSHPLPPSVLIITWHTPLDCEDTRISCHHYSQVLTLFFGFGKVKFMSLMKEVKDTKCHSSMKGERVFGHKNNYKIKSYSSSLKYYGL